MVATCFTYHTSESIYGHGPVLTGPWCCLSQQVYLNPGHGSPVTVCIGECEWWILVESEGGLGAVEAEIILIVGAV